MTRNEASLNLSRAEYEFARWVRDTFEIYTPVDDEMGRLDIIAAKIARFVEEIADDIGKLDYSIAPSGQSNAVLAQVTLEGFDRALQGPASSYLSDRLAFLMAGGGEPSAKGVAA